MQSRYYDPEIGRFINADSYTSTGQGVLGYNAFVYCLNNPIYYQDSCGSKAEEAEEEAYNCGLIGAGIQLELSGGVITEGIEIIVYWDIEQCQDNMIVAVYSYSGCSVDLSDPQFGSIIAALVDNQALIMADPENALSQIVAILDNSYSASVSGVLVFGNPNFKTVNDYAGLFVSISGSVGHGKAGVAFGETCLAVTIGATSSKKPAGGISLTNYKLRGFFVLTPHSSQEMYSI